jgi:hypothetical protein
MAHTDPWGDWLHAEERRKAHLNGAQNSNTPPMNAPTPPPVWGGWGQRRPQHTIRLPPALGRMGFPFVPPKPPPPSESELRALEFRRTVAGMEYNNGTGGFNPASPR